MDLRLFFLLLPASFSSFLMSSFLTCLRWPRRPLASAAAAKATNKSSSNRIRNNIVVSSRKFLRSIEVLLRSPGGFQVTHFGNDVRSSYSFVGDARAFRSTALRLSEPVGHESRLPDFSLVAVQVQVRPRRQFAHMAIGDRKTGALKSVECTSEVLRFPDQLLVRLDGGRIATVTTHLIAIQDAVDDVASPSLLLDWRVNGWRLAGQG